MRFTLPALWCFFLLLHANSELHGGDPLCTVPFTPFSGCGEIVAGVEPDCRLFRPEISDDLIALDVIDDFVPGCRVDVSGLTDLTCLSTCNQGCCLQNTEINACYGGGQCQIDLLTRIDSLTVTDGKMDNSYNCCVANCKKCRPDVYVLISVLSAQGTPCRNDYVITTVKVNQAEGSHPHQGFTAIFKDVYPVDETSAVYFSVYDDDTPGHNHAGLYSDRNVMADANTAPMELLDQCPWPASNNGPGANVSAIALRPIGVETSGRWVTVSRSLPLSPDLEEDFSVALILNVGLGNSGSALIYEEQLPNGFEFVSANPPPTSVETIGALDDEPMGTLATWEFPAPSPGGSIPISYTAHAPDSAIELRRPFRHTTIQDGMETGTGLVVEQFIIGGDTDCNNNGLEDLAEIVAGTVSDENGNLFPDVCEPAIPAVGEWGLAVILLMLIGVGTLMIRRNQRIFSDSVEVY